MKLDRKTKKKKRIPKFSKFRRAEDPPSNEDGFLSSHSPETAFGISFASLHPRRIEVANAGGKKNARTGRSERIPPWFLSNSIKASSLKSAHVTPVSPWKGRSYACARARGRKLAFVPLGELVCATAWPANAYCRA